MNIKNYQSYINLCLILFLLIILTTENAYCQDSNLSPADYVNFLIGTDVFEDAKYNGNNPVHPDSAMYGNEIPGPKMPDGIINPSPVTSFKGVFYHSRGAGYCYSDESIMGFTNLPTEYNFYNNLLLMPTVGRLYTRPGELSSPKDGYRSRKNFENEIAKPYYYSVVLKDYDIKAELTTTNHVALHSYTFPKSDSSKILLDLGICHKNSRIISSLAQIRDNNTITGKQIIEANKSHLFQYYGEEIFFAIKFSRKFEDYGMWDNFENKIYNGRENIEGKQVGVFVDYKTDDKEKIFVKVSISLISIEDALKNIESELPSWSFDQIKNQCKVAWNDILSRIEIEGGNKSQRTLFYTSLARSLNTGVFMGWFDNYEILFLLQPERVVNRANSNDWSTLYRGFIGFEQFPAVLSYYLRGAKDIDIKTIYDAYYKRMTNPEVERYGDFFRYGYIPYNYRTDEQSTTMEDDCVNRTLGYAYAFNCLSYMAEELGEKQEAKYLKKFSDNYKNIFDKKTGFMRAKLRDGSWLEPFDPTQSYLREIYKEGNAWQYTWMVPHDIPGLINLMGGKYAFANKLDELFTTPYKYVHRNTSGMIGNYTHGNGIDRYIPYLYSEAGFPSKTQKMVRTILDTLYRATPGGLTNNDDYGKMSAWYVYSAMGFLPPLDATSENYILGAPLFKKITIHFSDYIYNNNTFTIECENYSPENIYAKSVKLDGKTLNNFKLPFDAFINGQRLVFQMSHVP
ncbi:hypothetical protein GM418_30280 [Maribellus comscasis]|uniref:Glycoside hydrolase family 92 protein n=1 Tax=Maribellus comscasis TaxID=2681766 RepID=A0A6I6K851_9BACT|nr:GH92 family glycosyl hydrolase [Maribellus comscasis]QGY47793.1 hypothetical protein GM418_30280 [Maribellus comscasis]